MFAPASRLLLLPAALLAQLGATLTLDVDSVSSVKAGAANVAWNMMDGWYTGNDTGGDPGTLPSPYYWWEAGAMMGHLVDYWYYTGDTTYNQETIQAIVYQAGDNGFMPPNQTNDEGNDDQVFWAFAAMDAAELGFPAPSTGPAAWVQDAPSYLSMAQAVFNLQADRWDTSVCGGGLRWQIYSFNDGYDYKNVASNGGFFQLAARLARYTDNSTYLHWAEKEWDWLIGTPMIDNSTWTVNDGTETTHNCDIAVTEQFSYNYGILLAGLAYAWNHTQDDKWMTPLAGILNSTLTTFFPDGTKIMSEIICEPTDNCDADALTFKSFTLRWLSVTAQLVPQYADTIWPYISASASGAAGQCDGTYNAQTDICGMLWDTTTWDGTSGPGQQMSALAAIGANMIPLKDLAAPLTATTGGKSKSDPSAGSGSTSSDSDLGSVYTEKITTADRAGAGILTFLALAGMISGTVWLVIL